jgi:hypothetical protein
MVNLKTSARLVGEIGPLACQFSFVLIVGEKLHPFWAVTYHITGHIRVQGFYVSGMNISTYEAPGDGSLMIAGDIHTHDDCIVHLRKEATWPLVNINSNWCSIS